MGGRVGDHDGDSREMFVMAIGTSFSTAPPTVCIPGVERPFSLGLSYRLQSLREAVLQTHREYFSDESKGYGMSLPELGEIDSDTWAAREPDEDWLMWRARRCAERLRRMPIQLDAGELIVGKPKFRRLEDVDVEQKSESKSGVVDAEIPPFPGGDAGHFHPDYDALFEAGIGGIAHRIRGLRATHASDSQKRTFYDACLLALEGISVYANRLAGECEAMAGKCGATTDGNEDEAHWHSLAGICRHVSTKAPRSFHEAIQLMYITQISLWFGEDHGLTSPGRIDQTLRRFYESDLSNGSIDRRGAFELFCSLYIHMNNILGPGSAVSVLVGGRDGRGQDVTNDLTYLALAAREATCLVYPTVGLAWHSDTPDELLDYAMRMLGSGVGDPAFFNDELIADGLRDHDVSEEDSYNYMNSTCVEIKVVGRSNIWVTQPYINCPQALLDVMTEVTTGVLDSPSNSAALDALVEQRLSGRISEAAARLDAIWNERERTGCFPLASCLIRDCLERGRDFDRGGAMYNWVENSFVGLANLVDSLESIQHFVYDTAELTLEQFHAVLVDDFAGHERLLQRIGSSCPRYGNDNDSADATAKRWAEFLIAETQRNSVGPHRYVPGFFCWIMHERMGSQTGATPDGRRAGLPLADGAGAAQGREMNGPTASVLSTTKWSHRAALGGLVHNVKFSKRMLQSDRERMAARHVIETYLNRGGFEIQVNVIDAGTLVDAQRHPEKYPDLLVRVAGYSDYFVHLNSHMQDEVIARTEHEL